MSNANEPAYPSGRSEERGHENSLPYYEGMSQRAYAAIHLRIPDSGDPDLDAMIRKAQRRDVAARLVSRLAPARLLGEGETQNSLNRAAQLHVLTSDAIAYTDALLAALASGGAE